MRLHPFWARPYAPYWRQPQAVPVPGPEQVEVEWRRGAAGAAEHDGHERDDEQRSFASFLQGRGEAWTPEGSTAIRDWVNPAARFHAPVNSSSRLGPPPGVRRPRRGPPARPRPAPRRRARPPRRRRSPGPGSTPHAGALLDRRLPLHQALLDLASAAISRPGPPPPAARAGPAGPPARRPPRTGRRRRSRGPALPGRPSGPAGTARASPGPASTRPRQTPRPSGPPR